MAVRTVARAVVGVALLLMLTGCIIPPRYSFDVAAGSGLSGYRSMTVFRFDNLTGEAWYAFPNDNRQDGGWRLVGGPRPSSHSQAESRKSILPTPASSGEKR